MTKEDAADETKCNRNPQEHCSIGDDGDACLLNIDLRDCCGGICVDLGANGVCEYCDEETVCERDGYTCCSATN